jgi:hypothetical protein
VRREHSPSRAPALCAAILATALHSAAAPAQGLLLQQDTVDRVFRLSGVTERGQVRRIVLDTLHWRVEPRDPKGAYAVGWLTRHDAPSSPLPAYWLPGDDVYWTRAWLFCGDTVRWAEDGPDGRIPKAADDQHPTRSLRRACDRLAQLRNSRLPDSSRFVRLTPAQLQRAQSLVNATYLSQNFGSLLKGIDFSLGGLLADLEPGAAPFDYVGMPAAAWFMQATATGRKIVQCSGDLRSGECSSMLRSRGEFVDIDGTGDAIGALPGGSGAIVQVGIVFRDSCITQVAVRYPRALFSTVGKGMDDLSRLSLRALLGEPLAQHGLTDTHEVWQGPDVAIERVAERASSFVDWRWSRSSVKGERRPANPARSPRRLCGSP